MTKVNSVIFHISLLSVFALAPFSFANESPPGKTAICKCATKNSSSKCYLNAFGMEISPKKLKFERTFEGLAGELKTISGHPYITFNGFSYLDPHYVFQFFVTQDFMSKKSFQVILSATGEKDFQNFFDCKFSK